MADFKKVSVKIEFSLSMTQDNEFSELLDWISREQWGFLLELAAKRNMSVSRPLVKTESTSRDDE